MPEGLEHQHKKEVTLRNRNAEMLKSAKKFVEALNDWQNMLRLKIAEN